MLRAAAALVIVSLYVVAPVMARAQAPIVAVVELFTSLGCSSCPPADAVLRQLANRPDVLAMSLHVDYWDYLGWKDPHARTELVERQRSYARRFGLRYVYTPQMVINGFVHLPGTDLAAVESLIAAQPRAMPVSVRFRRDGGGLLALVMSADPPAEIEANIWFVVADPVATTTVQRGENGGRTLTNANVVRTLTRIDTWRGADTTVEVPCPGGSAHFCAVLIQRTSDGRILGAARWAAAEG